MVPSSETTAELNALKSDEGPGDRRLVLGACAAVALLICGTPRVARAYDWPTAGLDLARHRASTELSGPRFRASGWTFKAIGDATLLSSPTVADGYVVVGGSNGSISGIHTADGQLAWTVSAGDAVYASAAIDRGRVFVSSLDGTIRALRITDGRLMWERQIGGAQHSSPVVVDGSLVITGGFPLRKVLRIDAASGRTIWEAGAGVLAQFSNSSVAVFQDSGHGDGTTAIARPGSPDGQAAGQVIVGAMEGHVYSFDLATGAHRWTYEADGIVNLASPLILDGRVYLVPGGGSTKAYAIDLATGQAVSGWPVEIPAPAPDIAGTVIQRQRGVSSLATANGRLVMDLRFDDFIDLGNDGEPDQFLMREFVVALDPLTGGVTWTVANGRRVAETSNEVPKLWLCGTPALYQTVDGDTVAAVTSSLSATIRVLDAASGRETWSTALSGVSRTSPLLANGRLFVSSDDGMMRAFRSTTNQAPPAPAAAMQTGQPVSAIEPTLRWKPAFDPNGDDVSYQVRIDSDGEILESWLYDLTAGSGQTSVRVPGHLQADVTYTFAIRSRDSDGALSDWSPSQTIRAVATPDVSIDGVTQGSLAVALLAATPGQVVQLGTGVFYLTETLRVPGGVSLAGAGAERTLLSGKGLATAVSVEGSSAGSRSEVRSLTVADSAIGIAVRSGRDVRIANALVRNNRDAGIEVSASALASAVNLTIVANGSGVRVYGGVQMKNSLIADNGVGLDALAGGTIAGNFNDVFRNATADYRGTAAGHDDMSVAVRFTDAPAKDFRLAEAQPSTDRGDPADDYSAEPTPNGGRINLGAFGGTEEAERSGEPPSLSTGVPATPLPSATPVGAAAAAGAMGTDAPRPIRDGGGCSVAASPSAADQPLFISLTLVMLGVGLIRGRRQKQRGLAATVSRRRLPGRGSKVVIMALIVGSACLSTGVAHALSCTWNRTSGTNNWNASTAFWSCGAIPGTNDDVTFDATHVGSCTISAAANVNSITIQSGYSGTVSQAAGSTITIGVQTNFSQSGGTFTGNSSDIWITGTFSLSGGTFTSTSGILGVYGAYTKSGGTFNAGSGRVMLGSASDQTFATGGATFNNLYINDGLHGYWKFDESAGPSTDASGYGTSGTWNGSTSTTAAVTAPGLAFDNARSAYFGTSSTDEVNFSSPALPTITISTWIKETSEPNANPRVIDMPGYVVLIRPSGDAEAVRSIQIDALRGSLGSWRTSANAVALNTWYHIAVTYDGTTASNVPTLYINGVSQSLTQRFPPSGTQTSNFGTGYIGNNGTHIRVFGGYIDDMRIYDRVLTPTEVSSLAIGQQPGTYVATQTMTGAPTINGDLVIASGKLATAANSISLGGNWYNFGGVYLATGGTLTMTGSAASSLKILSGGSRFQSVTFNGSGKTFTLGDNMDTDPSAVLLTTAGTFDLSSYTLRTGDVNRTGAVTLTPSTGTVVFHTNASHTIDTGTYYNLELEPVSATNLKGYWKFDELQGDAVYDYATGASNNGSINGNPKWTASGATAIDFYDRGALNLRGSTDFVDVPAAVVTTSSAYTACTWVNFNSVANYQTMISIDGVTATGGTTLSAFYLQQQSGMKFAMTVYPSNNTATAAITVASTTVPVASTWYHLCGVFDGTYVRLYVNGASEGTPVAYSTPWTATGHTILGAAKWNGTRSDYLTGTLDDVRIYNTALSAAQIAALAAGGYPAGLAGAPTIALGINSTVTGTFKMHSGTFTSGAYTLNASTAGNVATLDGGTYTVGSAAQTFAGGLNVGASAALGLPTSGGSVNIGSTKTLSIDGTLSASSTGATIQTAGGAGTYYTFQVGVTANATPTLNISGLAVKNTDSGGMYINSVSSSTTTFTQFDNIAFSSGTGTRLLQIYAPTLYLVSNGCTFDTGQSATTTYNVTLTGNGTATETRALFGGSTCASNKASCEAYDNDDDAGADGIGDTTATNGAVIQWLYGTGTDTSGTIEGFPSAAFDWNTFTYYSTYVAYKDVDGGTSDRIFVRSSTGTASYSWDTPSGVDVIGTPRFDTVSSVHYVYVATTSGSVYRLIDNTGSSTLTPDTSGSWASNPYSCSCTIVTPLSMDTNNLYWAGTASGNKVWTLVKSTKALVTNSPTTVTVALTGAAPAVWTNSGTTYGFFGSTGHYYKIDATNQALTTDNSSPTGAVSGRLTVLSNRVYSGDGGGTMRVLDAASFGSAALWSFHDNSNHNGCTSGACAITGSVYYDWLNSRAIFGDSDGHLYRVYNSSGTTGAVTTGYTNFRPGTSSDVFGAAPLYNNGIIVAGTTTGNVYIIDAYDSGKAGGAGPVVKQTYMFGTATVISGIAYNSNNSTYMISAANATNKDGKLYYISAMTDPTPADI